MNIVVIAGTNRVGSNSKKIALYLCAKYEAEGCNVRLIDLAETCIKLFDSNDLQRKTRIVQCISRPHSQCRWRCLCGS